MEPMLTARNLRIICDIDNILADTLPHWLSAIARKYGVYAEINDINQYDLTQCYPLDKLSRSSVFEFLQQPGFTTGIPPMPGAVAVINQLIEDGHEVYLVTARTGATHIIETFAWVKNHLPSFDLARLVFMKDKHLIQADILIDDNPETLLKFFQSNPAGQLYSIEYPYNSVLNNVDYIQMFQYGDDAWEAIYKEITRNFQ
jgi:5'(3')-deoxyribonucleotidase